MMSFRKTVAAVLILLMAVHTVFPAPADCLTIVEEEKLGKEFMKMVQKQYRFIEDPFITAYVEGIGRKILAVMPPQPFAFTFSVIREDASNAFAGPGGHIFVNSGLMEKMDCENELAGILAHEISHVSARHISRKIERSSKIGLATLAGMVAGILLGVAGAGAAANAVTMGTAAAGQSLNLAYSRQDEMQADERGIAYLDAAGYSAEGMLSILKKIRDEQWIGSDQIPTYLLTHPAVEDRIAYIGSWVERHPKKEAPPPASPSVFQRVRTRLLAAYSAPESALKTMKKALENHPDDPLIRHGYGIALARNSRLKEAADYVRKALGSFPFDPVILKDMGEIYFLDGQYEKAHLALSGSFNIDPGDFETLYLLGRAGIELKKYDSAITALKKLMEIRPDYKRGLYYLGDAYGKAGNLGEAHYYLGKYYQSRRDFKNAVFHLRQAVKHSANTVRREEAERVLTDVRKEKKAAPEPGLERPEPAEGSAPPT